MTGLPNETIILGLLEKHLNKVLEYDPYQNFPGVKGRADFCAILAKDPAFAHFGLNDDRYVIARIGGNLVTSLHRKLGDFYEEVFKYLLKTRFGLPDADLDYSVDVQIGSRKQKRSTDGIVRVQYLRAADLRLGPVKWKGTNGLAFEVRSCYQIGDSKRIQADYDMALALKANGLTPIMLVFCNTSLRSPITRLSKSWMLFQGMESFDFVHSLTGFDLWSFLEKHSAFCKAKINQILSKP
jgi:hypothetical protein